MKRFELICLSLLLFAAGAIAQVTVRGTVTSAEDSEGLPGVSIIVKGTSRGTVSDIDGRYEIEAASDAILQFSFIGYKTVEKKAASVVNVVMESDAIMMNEVVSLGYSSVKKAELSSAVATISADALTDVTSSDVGNMLQGKIAGVQVSNTTGQPGCAAEIRIRGTGSITASSDPVYVVDGVMGGSFNPNDVETISVLKDAGATGIYGAAAAGGVIVVTTKHGANNAKPQVNVKIAAGMDQPLFGRYKKMNSEELYYYQKSFFPAALFKDQRPASLLAEDFSYRDEYFNTGVTQDYHISVSGGTQNTGYYVSFNYFNQDGTLKSTDYERFSGRANVNAKIAKWLDMSVRFNFDKDKRNSAYSWIVLDDAYNKLPWDNPYDYNTGEPLYVNSGTRSDNGKPWYSQYKWNALNSMEKNYNRDNGFSMGTDIQFAVHFTDWLTLQSTVRYAYGSYKNTRFIDPTTYDSSWTNGYLSNYIGLSNSIGTTTILKGGYQWGAHSFNALLGHEWSKWNNEYTSADGTGMPTGVQALNASVAQSVSGYEVPGASWAAFLQASYDYAKRYFVTATFRTEASSIFAPEHRVGYFPSVAASWLISNEEFMKQQSTVSFLKLRASYGVTGNNGIQPYQYLSTVALSGSYQNVVSGQFTRLSNPELHWETANMAALGVDLGFLKNRINMSIDLYNTDNTGLLLTVPQSPSTGFFEVVKNSGSVRNQGIEFNIDAAAIQTKDWRWDIGFNIGFNKNRVVELPNHTSFLQGGMQLIEEGRDMFSWYLKEWAGVDPANGDPLWYVVDEAGEYVLNEYGDKATTNDYNATNPHVVGRADAIFQGGLNTQVTWKGLSLYVNTFFNYGNLVYNGNRTSGDSDGAYLGHNAISLDNGLGWTRWQQPGDIATHPKTVYNGNKGSNNDSSRYLEDGSYFRLKNVTLSYDFATLLKNKTYFNKLRLYVSGDNLLTFTKFSGMDPECSLGGNGDIAGEVNDQYPVSRTIMFGLDVQF